MAIKFAELQEKQKIKDNLPLNEDELKAIAVCEEVIDRQISEQFEKFYEIRVDLEYFTFTDSSYSRFNQARRKKMEQEIKYRYERAGWTLTVDYGQDDGPNRPAMAFMILKGRVNDN